MNSISIVKLYVTVEGFYLSDCRNFKLSGSHRCSGLLLILSHTVHLILYCDTNTLRQSCDIKRAICSLSGSRHSSGHKKLAVSSALSSSLAMRNRMTASGGSWREWTVPLQDARLTSKFYHEDVAIDSGFLIL